MQTLFIILCTCALLYIAARFMVGVQVVLPVTTCNVGVDETTIFNDDYGRTHYDDVADASADLAVICRAALGNQPALELDVSARRALMTHLSCQIVENFALLHRTGCDVGALMVETIAGAEEALEEA